MPTANTNEAKYSLVFEGKIKEGAELGIVKEKLKRFFNNKSDRVEQLFIKEKIILRKNFSREQAIQFKLVFETSGAKCAIYKMKSAAKKSIPAKKQKTVKINKEQEQEQNNLHKFNDSAKDASSLAKGYSFNKKIISVLLVLIALSIVLWGSFYFINRDNTLTSTVEKNEQNSNKPNLVPNMTYILL